MLKQKKTVKKDTCMKFYYAARSLYWETDASGISLEGGLLQVWDGMNCRCNETSDNAMLLQLHLPAKAYLVQCGTYSNIKCEDISILHGLGKFHHYCFARKICIIIDHKPLVVILSKDVSMLLQFLQHILCQNRQIKGVYHIQAGPRPVHCRLVI